MPDKPMDRRPSLNAAATISKHPFAAKRSNQRRGLTCVVLLLALRALAPVFVFNTSTRDVLAQIRDHPMPLPSNATDHRTTPTGEAAECTTQSPESIRASGMHWAEQILFIETGKYRPGPFWEYQARHEKIFATCARDSPYARMHTDFRLELQGAAKEVLDGLGLHSNETWKSGTTVRQVHVCYMSRRRVTGRRRYFSPRLEPIIEDAIDSWAERQPSERVSFHRLEFDESVPLDMQLHWLRACTVLFGPHGAGLGHEIWMETEEGCVVEFGDAKKCPPVYGAMASWYGHQYICFSTLKGHGISMREGMYEILNGTLLLEVLDSVVAKQLAHLSRSL